MESRMLSTYPITLISDWFTTLIRHRFGAQRLDRLAEIVAVVSVWTRCRDDKREGCCLLLYVNQARHNFSTHR